MNVLMWFKRDLRVTDHPALTLAAGMGAVLPLYIVEPDYWAGADTSARQWSLTAEALADLRGQLAQLGAPLVVRVGPAIEVLARLCKQHKITHIISHRVAGHAWSQARDQMVAEWARAKGIDWQELDPPRLGQDVLPAPALRVVPGLESGMIPNARGLRLADDPCPNRQIGGRTQALALLDSFAQTRAKGYARGMHAPLTAERGCSRLSPHLALGAISLCEAALPRPTAYRARLMLREQAQGMAVEWGSGGDGVALRAWEMGETGLPFLDAAMRYVAATGWLNFRLREMVAAVAVQQLGLDWRLVGAALARRFSDYEPAILWPLMTAPTRVIHPVKLGLQLDPTGAFTRHWLPELASLPDEFLQNPWKWHGAGRILGRKYPEPLFDPSRAAVRPVPSVPKRRRKLAQIVVIEGGFPPFRAASGQMVLDL